MEVEMTKGIEKIIVKSDGDATFEVISSSGKTYKVILNRVYEDYEYTAVRKCSCPAAKFRTSKWDSCKHLDAVEEIASKRIEQIYNLLVSYGLDDEDELYRLPDGIDLLNDDEFKAALAKIEDTLNQS